MIMYDIEVMGSMEVNKILKILTNKKKLNIFLSQHGFYRNMSDESYLKMQFKNSFGYDLNLDMPRTFNEKLQWLKLNDRKSMYTTMVDKYEVKNYIRSIIGEEHIIPTLGVWNNFKEIDFDKLPNQFVLKCTHDSGGLVICRNKTQLNTQKAEKKINRSMGINYFWQGREWPYKNVTPRIIAEKYMKDNAADNLPVYKVFNFSGVPTLIQAIQDDKTENESIDYFDIEWNKLDIKQNFPNSKKVLDRPLKYDIMLDMAAELSKGFPFLRTDFYCINGDIYFSEFTFYSDSGLVRFFPEEWDRKLGDLIVLPM